MNEVEVEKNIQYQPNFLKCYKSIVTIVVRVKYLIKVLDTEEAVYSSDSFISIVEST